MVDLRRFAFDESLPLPVQIACRESFAMNVRKLAEFLVSAPKSGPGRPVRARDYLRDWRNSEAAVGRRIRWASRIATQLISGDERLTETSRSELDWIAGVLTVELERFAGDLRAAGHPDAEYFETQINLHVRSEP